MSKAIIMLGGKDYILNVDVALKSGALVPKLRPIQFEDLRANHIFKWKSTEKGSTWCTVIYLMRYPEQKSAGQAVCLTDEYPAWFLPDSKVVYSVFQKDIGKWITEIE